MTRVNAHKLFFQDRNQLCFLTEITIGQDERAELLHARQEIRSTLKAAAKNISSSYDYWENKKIALERIERNREVTVKFMTQGSFAYKTLNKPAQRDCQEIDLDDGMYVPVDFLDGRPALIAKMLFEFVEDTLEPLCAKNHWQLDKDKSTCVRVRLWPGAHIDLPIYSIPEDRYTKIVATEAFDARHFVMDAAASNAQFRLPNDQIMLANRDGQWIRSDPLELNDWVLERVEDHGEAYRRLCRFFKAWRDYVWEAPKLSSICLMVAIDQALKDTSIQISEVRDDELIMDVSSRLMQIFRSDIENPVVDKASLNNWDLAVQNEIIDEISTLNSMMQQALNQTFHAKVVVDKLQAAFGNRLPSAPDLVEKIVQNDPISEIKEALPATVPSPKVISSTSG